MNKPTFATAIVAFALLAGCDESFRGAPKPSFDKKRDINALIVKQLLSEKNINRAIDSCRSPISANGVILDSKLARNEIIFARMAELDVLYFDFQTELSSESRLSSFSASLAELTVGTSGAVISGPASQILSAISATITGTKEGFDQKILLDKTIDAFVSQMNANRDNVKADIISKIGTECSKYPVSAAISDLAAYRHAGTLAGALTGLGESAREDAEDAREGVRAEEKKQGISDRSANTNDGEG